MNSECTEETFQQAIKNIKEKFTIVAPIEDVDIVLALVGNYFGFNDIAYTKANIARQKIFTKENEQLSHKILARNHFDKKLYEYTKTHWESWKSHYIESISDNIQDSTKYLVISPILSFPIREFQINEDVYLTLEQINQTTLVNFVELPWY